MKPIDILREFIEEALCEAPVPLRVPGTPQQKQAMLGLVKWVGNRVGADHQMISDIVDTATKRNDWSKAIELLRDFYVLKGIKFQPAN